MDIETLADDIMAHIEEEGRHATLTEFYDLLHAVRSRLDERIEIGKEQNEC